MVPVNHSNPFGSCTSATRRTRSRLSGIIANPPHSGRRHRSIVRYAGEFWLACTTTRRECATAPTSPNSRSTRRYQDRRKTGAMFHGFPARILLFRATKGDKIARMDPRTPGRANVTRRIREEDLLAIEEAVQRHPEGATARQIHEVLEAAPPRRTLQYRLRSLVDARRLIMDSSGRWARYRVPETVGAAVRMVSGSPQFRLVSRPRHRGSPRPLSIFTIMSANRVTCDIPLVTTGRFSIHTGQTIRSISQTPSGRSFGRLAVLQALNNPPAPMPSTF